MGVEKHLRITGTSTVSWKDAIVQAVAEASKTIDYLSNVKIIEQLGQPPDHPILSVVPESEYLKGLICWVE